jgi:hypothetical protein
VPRDWIADGAGQFAAAAAVTSRTVRFSTIDRNIRLSRFVAPR